MTPHAQRFLHNPMNGQQGDCFRTCIACLLDVDPESVPHTHQPIDRDAQREIINDWLAPQGLCLITAGVYWPTGTSADLARYAGRVMTPGSFIISGLSSPTTAHVVIGNGEGIAHDPHPGGDGSLSPFDDGWWWVSFIGKLV